MAKVVSSTQSKRAYAIHRGDGTFYRQPGSIVPFELFTVFTVADGYLDFLKKKYPSKFFEVKSVYVDVSF